MPVTSLFHISDIHIRAGTSEASREDDYRATFDNLFGLLKTFPQIQEGAGIIVVTGDIFHHKNVVGPAGLDLAIYLLRGLSALATTVVIRGNHDYRQELSDEKDMIRALMAYDIEDLHYFDKTDTYEVENIGFGVLAIQDTLLEGATAGSKDVLPTMPSVEGFSEDVTHRVALYHGEVTKASLQTGYVHVNRHTLPLTQFEGYDLVLLGDIHQQQVKVAEMAGFSGETEADATRLTTYTTRTGSWGYPSSLLQQNYGESLLGHGMLHWDLAAGSVTEYHVHNPAGFVPLSVDAEETIRIQVRKGADAGGWMDETVLDEPWFPKRVRISVTGIGVRLSDSLLDRIRSSVEAHGIQVDRIHPSYATASSVAASSGPSGSSGPSDPKEKEEDKPISFYNSPEAWIQYIEEKNENKPLFEANPFWKDWVKTPSLALVPLDAVPPTLKPLFTTQNDKIFKSVAAFQKELDAFEQESRQTCVLSLQYLEWSWLFNFGPENWYNFTDSQNSIVVLNAKNGCGKSNFFETICLALFGEGFPSRDSAHSAAVLNNRWSVATGTTGVAGVEQGPARTLLLFSLQGTPYSLERVFERRKDRRLLDFKTVILRRADTGALEHQGINAVREWVKTHIGSVDMFLTSCMLTQDGDSNFFEKGADKQKEILDRVFSLHVVDELKTLLDVTYRAHGSCLTAVQAYLGGQGLEGGGGTLEELALLEKDLERIRSRRVALDAEAIVVAGQWADHSPKTFTSRSLELYREEWEGLPPEGEELLGAPSGDPSERARLQLRLEQLGPEQSEPPVCRKPNGSKQEAVLLLKQLRTEEAGLQGYTGSSTTRTLDECRTLLREAALWEKRRRVVVGSVPVADAEARLEALLAKTPPNPQVLSKLSPKAVAVLEETAKRCESDAAQVQRLGEALADYDATAARWLDVKRPLSSDEPFNPDCGACVSRKGGREGEKKLVQKRLTDLIDQFGERDDLVASHEEAVEAAAASSQALQDLEAWRQTQAWTAWKQAVQVAQADVAAATASATAAAEAAEEERHWTRVKAEAASDLAFLVRLEVRTVEADVAAWTAWDLRAQWDERVLVVARLAVVEAQLAAAEVILQKRTLGRILAAYPAYLRDKELLVERAALEADEGRLLMRRTEVRRALEVAGLQETLKKIEIRREMAGCLVSTLNGYTKWLSTDKLAPRLRQEVSGLLESICEDRPLTLEGVWEDKGSGHLSWFLFDGTDRVVFQKASGFQRFIVGMAMRIAMSRLGLCRAEYKQLFLDEGFTACDAENLEKVPAFLRSLLGRLDTILLASHLEDLKASGDVQVRIERTSSGVARIASGTRIASAVVEVGKARGRPKKGVVVA